MTTNRLSITTAAILILGLVACAPEKKLNGRVRISANDSMDAEQLALAGEQLISPYTFHLADKSFEMALAKDPDNKRAQLYRALLKPAMATKGIATRIKPLVRAHGNIHSFEKGMRDLPNTPAKDFLLAGQEDIRNADQAMDLVVTIRNGFVEMYEYLKANQNIEMTLNMNPHTFERKILANSSKSCRILDKKDSNQLATLSESGFEVECDFRAVAQTKIGPADMIAMRQIAASYIVYFTLFSSYSVNGIESIIREHESIRAQNWTRKGLTTAEIFERLEKLPTVGELRKDNTFKLMKSLGTDFLAAWKWVMKHQTHLCPAMHYQADKPRAGYLFEDGLCSPKNDRTEQSIALLEKALQGAVMTEIQLRPSNPKEAVKIDPMAFFNSPASNVKQLFPASFSHCADGRTKVRSVKDRTMGGILPDGDADRLLGGCQP